MRTASLLLLVLVPTLASAEAIYRCEGGNGQIAYQNRPCTPAASSTGPNPAAAAYAAAEQQRQQQLLKQNGVSEAERIRRLLKPSLDRRDAQYAENRQRCEEAQQVAAICGKHEGTFTCTQKGFRLRQASQLSTTKPGAADSSHHAYNVEQCALRVSKGRP